MRDAPNVSISVCVLEGLKIKNKILTFLFWVPKVLENGYFFNLYKFMDYNEVWFQDQLFMKMPRKNLQGVLFCRYRSKTFSSLSSTLIRNAKHVWKVAF